MNPGLERCLNWFVTGEGTFVGGEEWGYSGVRDTCAGFELDMACPLESGRERKTELMDDFGVTGRRRPGV
jgi:hypothetical protein